MSIKLIAIISTFFLITISQGYAQSKSEQEKQRERLEKKFIEDQNDRILEFVKQLNADDFQKEIIKQKIQSYYQAKKAIATTELKYFEKEEQLKSLDINHFADIKDIVSEDTMISIKNFTQNNNSEIKNLTNYYEESIYINHYIITIYKFYFCTN